MDKAGLDALRGWRAGKPARQGGRYVRLTGAASARDRMGGNTIPPSGVRSRMPRFLKPSIDRFSYGVFYGDIRQTFIFAFLPAMKTTLLFFAGFVSLLLPVTAQAGVALSNDDFANAALISGVSGTTSGHNTGATGELDEPEFLSGGRSIWWRWTAPEDGLYTFDTFGSEFDTVLGVYQGDDVADLETVAENDDGNSDFHSRVQFFATAGEEYYIAVDGLSDLETGVVTLNWEKQAALTLPVMVYNLRSVGIWEGREESFNDDDIASYVWSKRSTSVSTGYVIRGRAGGAYMLGSGDEVGPVAVIRLYSMRIDGKIVRSFTVLRSEEHESGHSTSSGFQSRLIRVNPRKTGVYETIYSVITDDFFPSEYIEGTGRAAFKKIVKNGTPTWFASKLKGTFNYYFPIYEPLPVVQGEPATGGNFKLTDTLTFNAKETGKLAGLDFDDAVDALVESLLDKGYEEE